MSDRSDPIIALQQTWSIQWPWPSLRGTPPPLSRSLGVAQERCCFAGIGPYDDDQEFDYAVDFVPDVNQHATAVAERWSVEGGGWGPNPRSLNEKNQNFKGVSGSCPG